jgi:predicted MPP superfamily phosphohydrolase
LYSFLVEPKWLEETHYTIESAKVDRSFKIVVLADIQTDAIGEYEYSVMKRVSELMPDMILFPGDYVQISGDDFLPQVEKFKNLVRQDAGVVRYGAWAVRGDVEKDGWESTFDGTGVQANDRSRRVTLPDNLVLTNLSLSDSRKRNISVQGEAGFHIVHGHAPDFSLGNVEADLMIAGHTHGGQVQIPFWGPPITLTEVPREQAAGSMSEIGPDKFLVVSRGIGMERKYAPRLRFWCRPELVVIHVKPE